MAFFINDNDTTTTKSGKRHLNTPKLAKQVPPFQPKGELNDTTTANRETTHIDSALPLRFASLHAE
jgi:hypothetical protein